MVLTDSVSQGYQWCLLTLFHKGIMVLTNSVSEVFKRMKY